MARPPAQVFWKGRRLAVLPRPQPEASLGHDLQLQLDVHRLSRLAPRTVGGAVVQHPVDATWSHRRQLCLAPGAHALSGVSGTGETDGLLVTIEASSK